jgi:hypothetical protein
MSQLYAGVSMNSLLCQELSCLAIRHSDRHVNTLLLSRTVMAGWAGIAQSVYRLATGWTVQGSNSGAGEIFRTRPDQRWGPPSLIYNG